MAQVSAEPIEAQLLRGRLALYIVVGVLVVVAAEASLWERLGSLFLGGLTAAYPMVATSRQQRLALAAGVDIFAGLIIWILMGDPVMALLVVLWGLTIAAFLRHRRATVWVFVLAVLGEAVKLPLVLYVFPGHRILGGETMATGVTGLFVQTAAKILIVVAAFHFLRLIGSVYGRAFTALHASAVDHSTLIEDAPTAVLVLDGSRVEYANSEACRLFGVSELTTIVSSDLRDRVDAADLSRFETLLRKSHEQPALVEDMTILPFRGSRRIVDVALTTVTFAGAERTQVALNDVTFRCEAQFALAQSEELFRGAFADSATPFGIAELDGTIVKVNAAMLDLVGRRLDEVLGHSWQEFMVPEDWRMAVAAFTDSLRASGTPMSITVRLVAADGSVVPVLVNGSFITDDSGAPATLFAQLIDLSAQVAAERQVDRRISQQQTVAHLGELALRNDVGSLMQEATEALHQHLDSFMTGVFLVRPDGSLVLEAGLGWPNGAVGTHVIPPGASQQMSHLLAGSDPFVIESQRSSVEFTPCEFMTDRGAREGVTVAIPGAEQPLGVVGVWRDRDQVYSQDDLHFIESISTLLAAASDRAAAQERLEELVTSKDRFLASVSHELRTPLTVVNGMAAELQENWKTFATGEVAEFVRLIAEQSRDMAALIEDLLVAARADIGAVTIKTIPVDVRREIDTVVQAMPDVDHLDNEVRHSPVLADASRIRQILRNLLTNAVRYGGPQIRTTSRFDGNHVVVSIADNGDGIPEDLRTKIFEPYQRAHTTAGVTSSVGLGLTVSRTLAELMGGTLTYRYVDGESVFDLALPAAVSPPVANVVSLEERRAIG